MSVLSSQYVQALRFSHAIPDETSWEQRLLEIGLDREAFCISNVENGATVVKFWEPDKVEALRVLARLERLQ
jgi:hypothetical protein